jgi:hypothetical protein
MAATWPGSLRHRAVAVLALFVFSTTSVGQYSPVLPGGDTPPDGATDHGIARSFYPLAPDSPFDEPPIQLHNRTFSVATAPARRGRASAADVLGSSAGNIAPRGRGVHGEHLHRQVMLYLQVATATGPDYRHTARPIGGDFREGMAASGAAAKEHSRERTEELPVFFSLRPNWEPRTSPSRDRTEDELPDGTVSTLYYRPIGDVTVSVASSRSVSSDDLSDYVQDFDQDPIEYRSVNGWTEDDGKARAANADGEILVDSGWRDGPSWRRWRSGMFWSSRATETRSGEETGVGAEAAPVGVFQRLLRWALRNPAKAAFVAAISAVFLAVVVAKNPTEPPGTS